MKPKVYGNTLGSIWGSHISLQNKWELRDHRLQLYWRFILEQLCGFEANFIIVLTLCALYQLAVKFLCAQTEFFLVETRSEVLL